MMVTKEEVIEQLDEVEDPELDLSIVELGLVYDVRFAAHRAALSTKGLDTVHINLVWTPRWDPKIHASEDAKMDMGIWD